MTLLRLKDNLDFYHQYRANKHGWLYIRERVFAPSSLCTARSIATGVVCTFDNRYIEEAPDALQEPEGSEI